MGSLFGGSQTQTSNTTKDPWAEQSPYLTQGFQDASTAYNNAQATGPYTGPFYAPNNATQGNAVTGAANWNTGTGATLPQSTANAATTMMGAASPFVSNAANMAANGIAGPNAGMMNTLYGYGTGAQTTQGPNAALSGALNAAAINGVNSLGTFQNTLQSVGQAGLSDPTQRIANDAATYANNPGVQQSINSTNALINQQLREQTVPQLNRAAAAGGSLNSSRAGMAEGMANENAALATGAADASILNNAYNTGMGTASNLYSAGLNNATSSAMFGYNDVANNANTQASLQQGLNEFNTNTATNAANAGLSQGLNYAQVNANTQLAANGQLGTAAANGINGATAAGNQAADNFALGAGAGALQQQGDQINNNNAQALYQSQYANPWQNLQNYWGIVGSGNWGGTQDSTSTGTTTPSIMSDLMQVGSVASGAMGLFGGKSK